MKITTFIYTMSPANAWMKEMEVRLVSGNY